MRGLVVALALTSMVSACAHVPGGAADGRGGWGGSRSAAPLRAAILPPEGRGGFAFHTNQPAYVAVFEILPGGGTHLMYPAPGFSRSDGFVHGGVQLMSHSGRQPRYADTYQSASWRMPSSQPRFFFMIASQEPLQVSRFGHFGSGLRSAMGIHQYAASNPYSAMERLVDLTVPNQAAYGSWTTDYYVSWPQVLYDRPGPQRVLVSCGQYQMWVAVQYVAQAQQMLCQAQQRVTPPAKPGDTTKAASAGKQVPPVQNAVSEKIKSSSQLQLERPDVAPVERREAEKTPAKSDAKGAESMAAPVPPKSRAAEPRAPSAEGKSSGTASGSFPRAVRPRSSGQAAPRTSKPSSSRPAAQPSAPARQPAKSGGAKSAPATTKSGSSGGSAKSCDPCDQP